MAYQAPYSGLAQVLAMQGRGPDTQLLHVTPMELRRLEAMAPNGRLPRNPETGLPEAGIFDSLGDIASIALPIAGAALLGPAIAPALGVSGLTGAAIGTGLGSAGAGLLQGKGLGESLIQGGLSGLMSYGLGSLSGAFAPSGGVTAAAPDAGVLSSSEIASLPTDMAGTATAFEGAVAPTAAESPGLFGQLREFAGTQAFPETIGSVFPQDYAAAAAAGQAPTYGSLAGAGLSGALAAPVGQGLGLMAPDEMPFDLAYDEYYPYYDADLEGGRERGRAAARRLNMPPSYASSGDLFRMASSPSGFGTFLAADGGQVPYPYSDGGGYDDPYSDTDSGSYSDPYGDTYGPGDPYGGAADEGPDTGVGPGPGPGPGPGTGPGMSLGLDEPVADLGFGAFNPTPMSLGLTALGRVPGPIGVIANVIGLGRAAASLMGPPSVSPSGQVQAYGYGNQTMDQFGNPVGSYHHTANLLGYDPDVPNQSKIDFDYVNVPTSDFNYSPDPTPDVESFAEAHQGEVGDAGGGATGGATGGDVGDDWSDIRLKRGIRYLGDVSGLRKYSWNYIWGGPRKVGVMAHELLGTKYADAVRVVDGYMRVDYSQLPEEVRTV